MAIAIAFLAGIVTILGLLIFALERVEIILGRICSWISILFKPMHKRAIKYSFEGHINKFIKEKTKTTPGFEFEKIAIEFTEHDTTKDAFIDEDRIVLRIKRTDSKDSNFVKAVFLFVSKSFLFKAKKHISPSQKEAADLFVTMELIKNEKPRSVLKY